MSLTFRSSASNKNLLKNCKTYSGTGSKVIAFGVFDGFHQGHHFFLNQAKNLGDFLVVVVARDLTVLELKKKKTKNSEKERVKEISSSGLANRVLLGEIENPYKILREEDPDLVALGYDQESQFTQNLPLEFREKIVRIDSFFPEKFKSSLLV